jgi:hypothetical protein
MCRLVFNLALAPCPRYSTTWEVTQLLSYIRSWGGNENLDLKTEYREAGDASCLSLIRLEGNEEYTGQRDATLYKSGKAGKITCEVLIVSFKETVICPITCLRSYERRKKSDMLFVVRVPIPLSHHHPL